MTLEQKIGQFFFPAVFINDTEENIQATEALIRNHNIGGLTFSIVAPVQLRITKANRKSFSMMTVMPN